MKKNKEGFTGYYDDNKKPIYVGDTLKSKYGYHVVVYKDGRNYFGKLICDDDHSCKNIPYSLNKGKDHIKINTRPFDAIMKKPSKINNQLDNLNQEKNMTEELSITSTQEKEINKWKSKLTKVEQSKNECINFIYLHGKVSSIYASIGKNILDLTDIK
jgi:hypothetical protein